MRGEQLKLLEEFTRFALSDEGYVSQFWSIGRSYFMLKSLGKERDLLSLLVIFQVRGSVAASGGHDPEELLRARMAEWGLQPDIDYNLRDVVLADQPGMIIKGEIDEQEAEGEKSKEKTRAYDFVLPFRTPGWMPRIFIQSQFYAGDSGSVSHKNIDQTGKSRPDVLKLMPNARFVEYVDGAGYFSSLRGDLRKLIEMPTTASFIQVRSASIRLRRELQHMGFLTPLEFEHAIARSGGTSGVVRQVLLTEGYSDEEIERCQRDAVQRGIITQSAAGTFILTPDRRSLVRRYLLLDVAAQIGVSPDAYGNHIAGSLIVPGYGPFHGVKFDTLAAHASGLAPDFRSDWASPEVMLGDIRWLCEQGMALSR